MHPTPLLLQGSIAACSAYDPCDLFSGDPQRLRRALAALLAHPQNNLLLFLDGQQQSGEQLGATAGQPGEEQEQQPGKQPADGQQGTAQEQAAGLAEDGLLTALLPLLPPGQRRGALAELLAAALEADGVLPRLLQAQQQCQFDVEGVYRLYCRLAGVPPAPEAADDTDATSAASSSSGGSEDASSHAAAVRQLMSLPLEEARAVLRSYVVAATAKDCAIMVTLQQLQHAPRSADGPAAAAPAAGGSGSSSFTPPHQQQVAEVQQPRCITVPACGGAWFRYRCCFVDLDLKPLAKIPQHWQLDRRILRAAQRHLSSDQVAAPAAAGTRVMPPA